MKNTHMSRNAKRGARAGRYVLVSGDRNVVSSVRMPDGGHAHGVSERVVRAATAKADAYLESIAPANAGARKKE